MRSFTTLRTIGLALSLAWFSASGSIHAQGIQWQTDIEQAKQLAAKSNRLVLVHFWAPWCKPCVRLDNTVFNQQNVAQAVHAHYVPVKVNASEFQVAAKEYGITSLPTDMVMKPDGQVVTKFNSPATPQDYMGQLTQIAASTVQSQPRSGMIAQQAPQNMQRPQAGRTDPLTRPAAAYGTAEGSQTTPAGTAQQAAQAGNPASPNPPARRYGNLPGPLNRPASVNNPYANVLAGQPQGNEPPGGRHNPSTAPPNRGTAGGAEGTAPRYASQAIGRPPGTSINGSSVPGNPAGGHMRGGQTPPANPVGQPQQRPAGGPGGALAGRSHQVSSPANPAFGLDGYCPVTLVEGQKWMPGDKRWGAVHRGVTYLFTGPEEQNRFLKDPDKYAPVLSGIDPVLALDQSQQVRGMRRHGVYYRDHVYLFASEQTLQRFSKSPQRYAEGVRQAMRQNGQRQ